MIDFGALARIGRDVRKGFEPQLDIKLREKEIHLLTLIFKHPNEPFVFYGRRLGLERGSFSYLSETLELKGLIIRKDFDNDKRKKFLELTDIGKKTVEEIERQFQEYLINLLSKLSSDEINLLNNSVETIKQIMAKIL